MKKFLSLVLALVMTMSLVTVSAGAKDFTDASKITYDEAVAVMSAAKVIDGYAEGDFRPTNTLTRGAAAKIICNLILGPTTAEALVADAAPYSDVPTTNVFAGYIAYCQKEGIISGYADGTFKPANSLTGYAFMKMLLGALGYESETEGYTGNNWSINVAKRALNIGLDDDLVGDFNGVKAVNREEACLYAFNTLKATMVEYENNNSVTVNGITFTNKSTAKDMVNNAKVETIKEDNKMQFAEKYFDKLSISTKAGDKIDDFGRPATTWVYDGDTVGTYADDADDSMVLNKTLTAGAVLATDSDYFDYNEDDFASKVTLYVNGDQEKAVKDYTSLIATTLNLQAGDEVEVFYNDDDEIETVAVIRYQLAKIDDLETSLSSTYTKKGATCSIDLKDLNDASIGSGTYYDVYDGDSSKELTGFASDSYKKDVVLAIAMNNANEILASHVAESVSGTITAYNNGSKANVTLSGTKYPLHGMVATSSTSVASLAAANYENLSFNLDDSTYAVYTDKNGYVIGIDETESVKLDDVYYVTGLGKTAGAWSNTVYAQAVSLKDGSVVEYKVKSTDADTAKAFFGSNGTAVNSSGAGSYGSITAGVIYSTSPVQGLYTFDKDGSSYTAKKFVGKITGSAAAYQAADSTNYVFATASTGVPAAITDDLAKDDNVIKLSDVNGRFYLNDKTQYIKVEDTGDDIDVKTVVGGTSVKQNNNSVTAIVVATKSNNNYIASYVILVSNAFTNAGSDDVVFVHERSNSSVSYKDADGKVKTGYESELYFLDGSGKVETVVTDKRYAIGFYTWEINDDEVYELTNDVASLNSQITATSGTYNYDDETGWLGFSLDSDGDLTGGRALVGIYNNQLSVGSFTSVAGATVNLDDVDFADNVIIRDDRSKADRDASVYTNEITSASQLKSAIDKQNSNVKAVLYYDEGKVVMVYVLYVAPATNNGGNPNQNATYTVSAAKKAATTTGEIELTVTSTDDTDTTNYTAKVFAFSIGAGKDTAVEIGSVSSTALVTGNSTVSVANNTNNSLVYYVEVTIDGDTLTTGTIIGG